MYNGMTTTLIGNITEPELRFTPTGTAVCTFSVAIAKRRRDDSGNWAEGEPTWVRVNAWKTLGEHVAESLEKGSRVIVSGVLENRAWTDDKGDTRYSLEMTADAVGADLTFATAKLSKIKRNTAPPLPEDPWAGKAPAETEEPPF
jgi:single-strand DNA-binding protein